MSAPHSTETVPAKSAWPMFIGALIMISVFLVIALLLRVAAPSGATDEIERAEIRRTNLADLNEADQVELTTFGWVDREKGTVRIPIEAAMRKEIAALNSKEPRPAYPIATPVPQIPEVTEVDAEQSATDEQGDAAGESATDAGQERTSDEAAPEATPGASRGCSGRECDASSDQRSTMTAGPTTAHPTTTPGQLSLSERALIDQSTRFPVLLFLGLGVSWLVVGSFLATLAAFELLLPTWFDFVGFLSFGRVQPAAINALVYGWASQAGIGLGIWLTARLCQASLRHSTLLVCSALVWNLAVMIGVLAILSGAGTSLAVFDMPGFVSPILLLAYGLMGAWAFVMFRFRRPGAVYVSMWYLLAAFLIFPWLYATASVLLVWFPVAGSATGPIHAWFANGVIGLWLVPIALGLIYYFIPRSAGRPIYSYGLATFGFWSLLLLTGWSGMARLIGGPVPVWMVTTGVVATVLLLIPMIAVATNLRLTVVESPAGDGTGSLAFFVAAFSAYALQVTLEALTVFPSASSVFHFTMLAPALDHLLLGGLVTLTLIGGIFAIVPGISGRPLPFPMLRSLILWLTVTALGTIITAGLFGGMTQGFSMRDSEVTFIYSVRFAEPYRLMVAASELLLLAANAMLAVILAWAAILPIAFAERAAGPSRGVQAKPEVVTV